MSENVKSGGVDFHCHLDLYPDFEAAVARAEAARIYTLTVTTTPKAWQRNQLATQGTRYVRAALGLHPQLVAERSDEFALWEECLPQARYVGEVGLDAGPRFFRSLDAQKKIFQAVLERCAADGGKVLTIHSVRTVPMILDMLEQHFPRDRGIAVLHWFSGSKAEVHRAVALGCYFSVNAEMARSARGRKLIAELPEDRFVTETDGPFTQIDGRPTEPRDVTATEQVIASVRGISVEAVATAVRSNLRRLLTSEVVLE